MIINKKSISIVIGLLAVIFFFGSAIGANAETCTWTAASSSIMSSSSNWSGCTLSGDDDLLFDGAVTTTNATWDAGLTQVASTTVSSSYSGTITFGENVSATTTGNFVVNGGIVQAIGGPELNVGGNFTTNLGISNVGLAKGLRMYGAGKTLGGTATSSFTTLTIDGDITLAGNIWIITTTTINPSKSLNAATYNIRIAGSGTPLIINGTFNANTSTVIYESETSANIASTTYYNLAVNTTGTLVGNVTTTNLLTIQAGMTLSAGGNTILFTRATGTPFVINGTFTSNTSTVNYAGATSANIATSTYYNLTINTAGTMAGNVTTTNILTINAGKSLSGGEKTITLTRATGTPFVVLGTFTASSSTVNYAGATSANILSTTYYNLTINTAVGTLTGNATSTNDVVINTNKTFELGLLNTFNIGGNLTVNGALQDVDATVNMYGTDKILTSNGSNFNVGVLNITGSTTLSGSEQLSTDIANVSGTLNGGDGTTLRFSDDLSGTTTPFVVSGTFNSNTSTISYNYCTNANITSLTYYNLLVSPCNNSTSTLIGNATTTNFTNSGNFILASGKTLFVSSTLTNSGTITETGIIKKSATSIKLTDSSGTEVSSYTGGTDSVYISITDPDGNLNGSTADTITGSVVTENTNSDSETITLTETGAATGIFRSAALAITGGSNAASNNSGAFNVNSNGTLSLAYTDSKDSTDTGSDTASFTASAYSAPSTGGGGGGSAPAPVGVGLGTTDKSLGIGQTGNIGTITTSGINYLAYINSNASFDILVSKTNQVEIHQLTITNLDLFSIAIKFVVQSTPQTIDLKLGQIAQIDLDADGIKDMEIKFANIWMNRAELTLKALVEARVVKVNDGGLVGSDVVVVSSYQFKRDFSFGMTHVDIKELQKYLNSNGFSVAKTGAGSPGKETTKFGSATKTALIKFQKANNLATTGKLDSATRVVLNGEAVVAPVIASAPTGYVFKSNLYPGSSGVAVKELQQKLKELGHLTATPTGYYGPATKAAVVKFQKANNLKPYPGSVGPATRAMLNSL